MPSYSVHCLGLENSQQQAIIHVLELAENALTASWVLTENTLLADIIMLDLNSNNWDLYWADLPNNHNHQHVILMAAEPIAGLEDYPFLQCKKHSLPSLRDFSSLLNQLAQTLAENTDNQPTLTPLEIENSKPLMAENNQTDYSELLSFEEDEFEEDEFEESESLNLQDYVLNNSEQVIYKEVAADNQPSVNLPEDPVETIEPANFEETELVVIKEQPKASLKKKPLNSFNKNSAIPTTPLIATDYLFGLLHQLKKSRHFYRRLSLENTPALLITPLKNSFYFSGSKKQLLHYFCSTAQQLTETELTEFELQHEIDNNAQLHSYSLSTLIGYSVLANSKGRLLDGHTIDEPYPLFIEPDISAIPDLQIYQPLTEYMLENPEISLIDTAEQLNISLKQVIDYYNLCVMLGCTG